jgi:hypothetical protein
MHRHSLTVESRNWARIYTAIVLTLTVGSINVNAITACVEHGLCDGPGIPWKRLQPQIPTDASKYCKDSTILLRFDLINGRPQRVEVVQSNADALDGKIVKAFEKWLFDPMRDGEGYEYLIKLTEMCVLKEDDTLQRIIEKEINRTL